MNIFYVSDKFFTGIILITKISENLLQFIKFSTYIILKLPLDKTTAYFCLVRFAVQVDHFYDSSKSIIENKRSLHKTLNINWTIVIIMALKVLLMFYLPLFEL